MTSGPGPALAGACLSAPLAGAYVEAMVPVLEAVPNVSEGRDPELLRELVRVVASSGVEVLDHSADHDHNRAVLTFVGGPQAVEDAAFRVARLAVERIDLRRHQGVHPRVGALDVLPFVPLRGLTLEQAAASAHRVGRRLADELDLPVYWYGAAAPGGRRLLSELRRGGFEALRDGFPAGREPDLPEGGKARGPHPTAGVTCVGARPLLLAWNVYVAGVELEALRSVARDIRESGGGFPGLRALALELRSRERMQISMNLEDLETTDPFRVFRALEARVEALGGRLEGTEVIGMIPDALVLPAAGDRLGLFEARRSRLLSARLARHLGDRVSREVESLGAAVREAGPDVPEDVRAATRRLIQALRGSPS